jgi:hypothetical protein
MEGSDRSLIKDAVLAFVWRDQGEPWKIAGRIAGLRAGF